MEKSKLMMTTTFAAIIMTSILASGLFVDSSFAQENMTTATNETGGMMGGNQTNQTGGNQSQGPLEQLGETLGGVFGGGNQSE